MEKKEIFDGIEELAQNGIGNRLKGFYMFAMTHEDVREFLTDEMAGEIYILIDLLDEAAKIEE